MRGRKPLTDRPGDWHVKLPSSLIAHVEEKLPRNVRGKIPQGTKAELTRKLLEEWLETFPDVDLGDLLDKDMDEEADDSLAVSTTMP